MASEVDIANLALAHLGDDATVSSFNPAEGSAQAEHCARWYPIARDSLLQQHDWGFATRKGTLVQVNGYVDPTGEWQYAYAKPNNCIKVVEVRPPATANTLPLTSYPLSVPAPINAGYNRPAAIEFDTITNDNGDEIIVTNQIQASIIYIIRVTDTSKFSPLFVDTLSWYLGGYLAGPVIKGEEGRAEAKGMFAIAMNLMGKATTADANQRIKRPDPATPWVVDR